ncbi:histone-like nucleoid-structuring protein, MvaT/MvaU family [Salinicola sp. MIT1003]|uniref:histone-like nucleoid-structuring protein, MvaT/MvaU family n=1 Tax=Salinicola sp. MIT1003 TaxID=1882734 RepID=UPI0008DC9812|nr:histone-like nucleoid-structuring protein, MvaT/MvaU family [Salinicola sp. MIT1003]OHZ03012.1 H-NS histone [Salinicola sp. MIT1003]
MASQLADYMQKEAQLARLQAELKEMEGSEQLKLAKEYKQKLEELMKKYGHTVEETIDVLDPEYKLRGLPPLESAPKSTGGTRRKRKLKVYKNPNTGEVIETRGGNHKELKAWKDEHGAETVESWVQEEKE